MTDYKDLADMAATGMHFGEAISADILALIAENEANKDRADAEQESYDSQRRILDAVKAERDKLKAENEVLRKWNERYEWLRKGSNEAASQDQSWSWEKIDEAIAKEKAGD